MEINILYYQAAIAFFIVLSGFFSAAETAVVSSIRMRLESLVRKGNRRAGRAIFILDNIEDAIGMILIGNNVANIAATSFITYVATRAYYLGERELVLLTAAQTVVFLVVCELTPKVIARARPERSLMVLSYPVIILMILLKPLSRISLVFSNMVKRIMGVREMSTSIVRSRDELDFLFKLGHKEGLIYKDHHIYVSEILSFRDIRASEIITPTVNMVSFSADGSVRDLVEAIDRSRFSRIPVFRDRVDNIIGYVFYRDLLRKRDVKDLGEIIQKPYYVPSTKNIYELYQEMYENSLPLVFVVNEYGGVTGMITKEDIAEEVVGEIQTSDHHDSELITKVSERKYILAGSLDIEYFQRYFSIRMEKKNFETISGFINYRLQRIPRRGDTLTYENYTFTVEEATERRAEKVVMTIGRG